MAARTSCVFLRRAGRSAKNKGIIINCNSPTWGQWREHHEIPQYCKIISVPDKKKTENEKCDDLDICLVSNPKRRIEFTGEVYRIRGLTEMMKKLSLGEQNNVRSSKQLNRGNHLTQTYCAADRIESTMVKLTLCDPSSKQSENVKQDLKQKEKDDLKKRLDKLSKRQIEAKKKLAELIGRKLEIERSNFERLLTKKRTEVQYCRKVKREKAMNKVRSNILREKTSFQVKAPESKRKVVSGTKQMDDLQITVPNKQIKFRRVHKVT